MFAPVLCLLPTLNVYSFPCLSCSLVSTFFYCLTHSLSSIPPPSLTAHASGNNNVWLIYLDVRVFPNVSECSRLIWRGLNRTGCFVVLVTERKWILFLRGIFMRVLIGGWAGDHSLTRLVGILWIGRIKKINRIIYGMLAYWIFDQSYISLATLVSDVFFFTRSPCRASSF